LVTDSLPALALAVDPAAKDVMKRKPIKPGKGVFTKGMSFRIIYQGIMIGAITLIAFCVGLSTPNTDEATRIKIGQTMAFFVLALSQLIHVYNIRNNNESIFKTGIFNNSKLILATIGSAFLMFIIVLIPALRTIFGLAALPIDHVLEVILLVLSPIAIVEIFKLLKINTVKEEKN
jgi:P-type Ca2+ transporter type 2C